LIIASSNNFFRLFVAGYAITVFTQIFINIGMNLGLLPIAGISLPFISYGGSNLLINFIALGIIQNIVIQTKSSVMKEISREA
jgi:rod shape determining protein RodA